MHRPFLLLLGLGLAIGQLFAQNPETLKLDPEAIQVFEKLVKAYNAGEAKNLGALWTEEAELITEDGETLQGRKTIEESYAKTFQKNNQGRLDLELDKVRRISKDVLAVEGRVRVLRANEPIDRSGFAALLVRQGDGSWLIDSVREFGFPGAEGNAENLKELAWLNGTWKYSKDGYEVQMDCTEVANGNFRAHRFRITNKDEVLHEGTQIVGWDPLKNQIRSWVFSSDGSFGDGTWEKKENQWFIRVTGVLPDGFKTSATQVVQKKDQDHFSWAVIDRVVDSRVLPNAEAITLTRQPGTAQAGKE